MADLLFYQKPVPLNKSDHKNKKIKSDDRTFRFAARTNSVILAGVEFSEAAKEYPIVFAQAGEQVVPVALLGLHNAENLYVNGRGEWDAQYVPAFVRRYPFVLADTSQNGQQAVCIDESFEGFNDDDGEPLFEGDNPAPILEQAMKFLEEYQKQYKRTEVFVQRLQEMGLLMSLNAQIDMVDGEQFGLTGLLAVDERKLLQLDDEKALSMFRNGELSWVYCHLLSLGCMGRLVDRLYKRKQARAVAAEKKAAAGKEKAKAK